MELVSWMVGWLVRIIQPLLHTHTFIYHSRCGAWRLTASLKKRYKYRAHYCVCGRVTAVRNVTSLAPTLIGNNPFIRSESLLNDTHITVDVLNSSFN